MKSESVEEYLEAIFKFNEKGEAAKTAEIAAKLKIAPPSVTEMIKKLADQGSLTHTPYKGVTLTDSGKIAALKVIRRHRLWEMFLVEVLHFGWDEIDEEADRFEHVMSQKMEDKIDEVLGYPSVDPHGHPIPAKNGSIKNIRTISLSEVEEGTSVCVTRVNDANAELLRYASAIGISLNKKIVVRKRIGFDNSLIIKIGNKEISISSTLASNVFVESM